MPALGGTTVLVTLSIFVVGAALVWAMRPAREDPARIELGRRLYHEHCASCHGAQLEGEPDWQNPKPSGRMPVPPHDASGHTWHHSDQELFRITKHGMSAVVPGYASDMPAFEQILPDREIAAVLAFIRSSWPEREREYQAARTRIAEGRKR
jgi:mono/diheme cytochrome c family protein